MTEILKDKTLMAHTDHHPEYYDAAGNLKDKDTIILSIASYRDPNCAPTVARAFANAKYPDKLHVGVVQQNCHKNCVTGTGWAETRHTVKTHPDAECLAKFCAGSAGKKHCEAGQVRLLALDEEESYGPLFARYLASKLWKGEQYFMQVDSHSHFAPGWDETLRKMIKLTPNYPRSILSNYPPGNGQSWTGGGTPEALCDIHFADDILRLEHTGRDFVTGPNDKPRPSLFIAAGFLFTTGNFLTEIPFDPFLPYIFMGEEIIMSARAWTHGWDVYGPSVDVVQHEYVRQESPKFWETVGQVFHNGGLHNDLTHIILDRIKYQMGFPERIGTNTPKDKSLIAHLDKFGLGKKRPIQEFFDISGINVITKTCDIPATSWCRVGKKHKYAKKYGLDSLP